MIPHRFTALLLLFVLFFSLHTISHSSVLAFAMPSDDASTNNKQTPDDIPQLPAADPDNKDVPRLQLGETLKLDAMGPIILNSDGTTRRIANWDSMTKQEQQVTWRRIQKRNEERRKKLLQEQAESKDEEF